VLGILLTDSLEIDIVVRDENSPLSSREVKDNGVFDATAEGVYRAYDVVTGGGQGIAQRSITDAFIE
jgi:hypothetical protein